MVWTCVVDFSGGILINTSNPYAASGGNGQVQSHVVIRLGGMTRNRPGSKRIDKLIRFALSDPNGDSDIHSFIIEVLDDTTAIACRAKRMKRNTTGSIKN